MPCSGTRKLPKSASMADGSTETIRRKRPASDLTAAAPQDPKLAHDELQTRKRPSIASGPADPPPATHPPPVLQAPADSVDDQAQGEPTFELVNYDRPQAPMHPSQMLDEDPDNNALNDNDDSGDDMLLDNDDTAAATRPRPSTTLLDTPRKDPDSTDPHRNTSPCATPQPASLGGKSLAQLQQSLQHHADAPPAAITNGLASSRKPTEPKPPRQELRTFRGLSSVESYEISQTVGEGTFGVVTIGTDKRDGRTVALKKIGMKNEREGLPVTALREIKILKMMNHPNVIELIEIATKKGDPKKNIRADVYMVFPYMDHDLSGIIESHSIKLHPSHIKSYMKQLLEGTAYLHQAKLLHRDMKTANILIDNQGNLKLADFGLARTYNQDERKRKYTNMVVTRWYRPPELILGETKYGPAVDMWGIGCVFGEMLRRQPILPGGGGKENEEEASFDQLEKIFRLRGTPTQESWPDWDKLPKWAAFGGRFKNSHRPADLAREFLVDVRRERIDIDASGLSLLGSLLILDPKLRLQAKDALMHPYFNLKPFPARPGTSDFPQWEASHELDARKRKELGIAPPRAANPMGHNNHPMMNNPPPMAQPPPPPQMMPPNTMMGGGPPMPPPYHQQQGYQQAYHQQAYQQQAYQQQPGYPQQGYQQGYYRPGPSRGYMTQQPGPYPPGPSGGYGRR
ncbi:hypothetical protein SeLEV6574_g00122 [Synchytrium endobioticum]|uniref:Protein kinase domain-containing protein n=1 Tax=Synchytrium endobioticum TaxID=286115 RepID=A0A507DJA9_9FUNG|nr:hypothetical protein SeLEV6574_g00122 [Synchytrium endobioticum]